LTQFFGSKKIIQAHEVDFRNRLRIDSLFILLQDTAASHADSLDLGYSSLIKHNLAWVLSWVKVKIDSFPGFGDEIRTRTWPKKKYKLYSLRDFYIYNKNEDIICRATTAWLPINIITKRIIDTASLPAPINYQEKESAINELPHKVTETENKEFILSKKVRYTDLDLNQHVNNIRYIELIMDSFPVEHYEKFILNEIEVNFISESKYDDEIEIYKNKDSSEIYSIIGGENKENSKRIFHARLKWNKFG
jgi:medium-chain acyl-[acyl-carrier-protein] hydrolase